LQRLCIRLVYGKKSVSDFVVIVVELQSNSINLDSSSPPKTTRRIDLGSSPVSFDHVPIVPEGHKGSQHRPRPFVTQLPIEAVLSRFLGECKECAYLWSTTPSFLLQVSPHHPTPLPTVTRRVVNRPAARNGRRTGRSSSRRSQTRPTPLGSDSSRSRPSRRRAPRSASPPGHGPSPRAAAPRPAHVTP
jgi:hypothetical protein